MVLCIYIDDKKGDILLNLNNNESIYIIIKYVITIGLFILLVTNEMKLIISIYYIGMVTQGDTW